MPLGVSGMVTWRPDSKATALEAPAEARSMAISVTCTCGKQLKAKDEHAGKKAKCPLCGASLTVPVPTPAADDSAEYALAYAPPAPAAVTPGVPPPASRSLPEGPSSFVRSADAKPKPTAPPARPKAGHPLREYAYWLLLLTFIPLALSLANKEKEKIEDRLEKTMEKASPEVQ